MSPTEPTQSEGTRILDKFPVYELKFQYDRIEGPTTVTVYEIDRERSRWISMDIEHTVPLHQIV